MISAARTRRPFQPLRRAAANEPCLPPRRLFTHRDISLRYSTRVREREREEEETSRSGRGRKKLKREKRRRNEASRGRGEKLRAKWKDGEGERGGKEGNVGGGMEMRNAAGRDKTDFATAYPVAEIAPVQKSPAGPANRAAAPLARILLARRGEERRELQPGRANSRVALERAYSSSTATRRYVLREEMSVWKTCRGCPRDTCSSVDFGA